MSAMYEPDEVLQTLTGRGHVWAEGMDGVRVRYRVVIERRAGKIVAHGTVTGSHAALHPVWLQPDSTLRLKNGRRIEISITDLLGDVAEFESTGTVGTL